MPFSKMKPQANWYRKYKGFYNETFSDSLRYELNIQERFLNEKDQMYFQPFIEKFLINMLLTKSDIYDLTVRLSLIMKLLRQSWRKLA